MTLGRWVRKHCWPWTAVRRAWVAGFEKGVEAGASAMKAHVRELAQRAALEEMAADAKEAEQRRRAARSN